MPGGGLGGGGSTEGCEELFSRFHAANSPGVTDVGARQLTLLYCVCSACGKWAEAGRGVVTAISPSFPRGFPPPMRG